MKSLDNTQVDWRGFIYIWLSQKTRRQIFNLGRYIRFPRNSVAAAEGVIVAAQRQSASTHRQCPVDDRSATEVWFNPTSFTHHWT